MRVLLLRTIAHGVEYHSEDGQDDDVDMDDGDIRGSGSRPRGTPSMRVYAVRRQ